jgi:hypothetical protein
VHWRASGSTSGALWISLRPSRSHWIVAPPMNTPPSRQYWVLLPICQPMVVISRLRDVTGLSPVFIRMKQPVP